MSITIRTADQLTRVLAASLDPPLKSILEGHRERLAEYTDYAFEELAAFFIFESGDRPEALQQASGTAIFADPPGWEYLDRHDGWFEACFVLSDDGFGWIVLVPDRPDIDGELLALCRRHTANA